MIGKDKLGFDATDVDTIEASDSVGAFLRASDGTLLTHTDVGGKKALDVNMANTLSISATDLDIRDLAFASDSVTAHQGGTWTIDSITSPVTVSATDLDIRDLDSASDSIAAVQSGTWDVNISDNGGSITVDSVDLDIRDLSHAQDSIRIGDGTNFQAYVGSTGIARSADFHDAAANSAISVDTTAGGVALVASALSNRSNMFVQNLGNRPVFLGVGTVTAANGLRLAPNSTLEARIGAVLSLKAIADGGSQDIRVLELA